MLGKYTLEKSGGPIKNGQSIDRDTKNIQHTRQSNNTKTTTTKNAHTDQKIKKMTKRTSTKNSSSASICVKTWLKFKYCPWVS